jgi:nucleoid-associated protein YgaU
VNPESREAAANREAANAAVETHRVQPGDSFASLAVRYYGSERYTQFLIDNNPNLKDPNHLPLGTAIKIPPAPPETALRSKPTPAAPAAGTAPEGAGRTYKVRAGDTFYSIARERLGDASRWKELLALNKELVNGDATQLRIGQVLRLPDR